VVAAGQDSDPTHESDELTAMKQIQWGDSDSAPDGWGTIDTSVYQTNADVVQQYGDVKNDIDVESSVDTSIYPGN
jgi:hypothetical protein